MGRFSQFQDDELDLLLDALIWLDTMDDPLDYAANKALRREIVQEQRARYETRQFTTTSEERA